MAFKQITIADPLAQLPSLTLYPDRDEYSRSEIDRRKSLGRTMLGATKIGGAVYDEWFQWQLNFKMVHEDKIKLFQIYAQVLNKRLSFKNSQLYPGYLHLADEFRKVPATATPEKYTFVSGSTIISPYTLAGGQLTEGYAVFKVLLTGLENPDHIKELGSCRYSLSFGCEEVSY